MRVKIFKRDPIHWKMNLVVIQLTHKILVIKPIVWR